MRSLAGVLSCRCPRLPAAVFLSETENPALITPPAAGFQATGVTEMEIG